MLLIKNLPPQSSSKRIKYSKPLGNYNFFINEEFQGGRFWTLSSSLDMLHVRKVPLNKGSAVCALSTEQLKEEKESKKGRERERGREAGILK